MTTTRRLVKNSWLGPWLVGVLCVLVLALTTPQEAAATAVEYAVMLALIIVVCITADLSALPPGSQVVAGQLLTAGNNAVLANSQGDRPKEIGRLSKAIGAAEALLGMMSACDACDELRSDLQEIIGHAASLKANALGTVSTCHPNGVIQPTEQCDPLAVPTGCPVSTVVTFCSDECLCEPIVP